MKKVNVQLIKSWVEEEIVRILKSEDEIVVELVNSTLDARTPNIKELQINLTGFLNKDAPAFCKTLWKLCLSAQDSPHGVPKELLEAKKAQLAQEKAEEEEAIRLQEEQRERDREFDRMRDRERDERERLRHERGRGRGGRGGRDFDRRAPRDFSPPSRYRDDDDYRRPPPPRATDSYIPRGSPRRRAPSYTPSPDRRARSPPRRGRSSSPSRTPPQKRLRRNSSSDRSHTPNKGYPGRDAHSRSPRRYSNSPRDNDRGGSRGDHMAKSADLTQTCVHNPALAARAPIQPRSRKHHHRRKRKLDALPPDDLMPRPTNRSDGLRLSRETSSSGNENASDKVGDDDES